MNNGERLKLIDELMTKEQKKADECYSNYMGGGSQSCMRTYRKHEDIMEILEIARTTVLDLLRREQLETRDERLKRLVPPKETSEYEHQKDMEMLERMWGSDDKK